MAKASAKSAIELLAEMEAKHKEAVREIKEKATDEIREQLKEARAVVKGLEDELEALTGLRSKVGSGGDGTRAKRLPSALLTEVGDKLLKVLGKTPLSKGALAEKIDSDVVTVAAALAKLKREDKVKSNGMRGNNGAWLAA